MLLRSFSGVAVDVFRPATEHVNGSHAGDSTGWIAAWGIGIALTLATAAGAAHLVDWAAYDSHYRLLNLTTHRSVFGAVSLLSLAAVTAALTWLCWARRTWEPTVLALVALSLALLGLRTAHPAHVFVVAVPLAAATFVLLWWRIEPRASMARRLLRLGCVTLAISYGLHAFGASAATRLGYGPDTWLYQVEVVVEHCAELAGWILIATGVAELGYAPRDSAER